MTGDATPRPFDESPLLPQTSGPIIAPPADGQGYAVPVEDVLLAPRSRQAAAPPRAHDAAPGTLNDRQFSLAQLLGLLTVAALVLAPATMVPLPWYAGLLGGCALAALGLVSARKARSAIVHLAWWLVLLLYLVTAIAACLRA